MFKIKNNDKLEIKICIHLPIFMIKFGRKDVIKCYMNLNK